MTAGIDHVHVAFNLVVNTVGSFVGALALVYAVLAAFRIGPSRGGLALLLLPFVKVLWDLIRGIPSESFFWHKLDGARQELGSFQVGFGLTHFGLFVQAKLGARFGAQFYPQSMAELFDTLLSKKIGAFAPGAFVALCIGGAAVRLLVRSWHWARFRREAAHWRADAYLLATRRARGRLVPIYVASHYTGVPFTAGIVRPYVLLPARMLAVLSPSSTQAVIEHELTHVRFGDPLLTISLALVSDVLWFLPGRSGLVARVQALLEQRADAGALAEGADSVALASAIVTMGEILVVQAPANALPFFRDRLVLTRRLRNLLEPGARSPRWGYRHWLGKAAILAVAVSAVLQAVFLGNYR